MSDSTLIGLGFLAISAWLTAIAAFITNIIWIFMFFVSTHELTIKIGVFMIVSVILPFVGIIHGLYIWFNGWTFL